MWSVLRSLHKQYENELNFSDIELSVKVKGNEKFEKQNP